MKFSTHHYEGHPESKERLRIQSAHLFCCSRSLVSGVQWPWNVASCSCTSDLVTWYVQRQLWLWLCRLRIPPTVRCEVLLVFAGRWNLRFSYRRGKLSRGIVLFHDNARRILLGIHNPCCVSNSTGTSSSILRTVRTWYRRTFFCFQKWRSTLLVNASQIIKTWRMMSAIAWYEEGIHKVVSSYHNCLNVKGD